MGKAAQGPTARSRSPPSRPTPAVRRQPAQSRVSERRSPRTASGSSWPSGLQNVFLAAPRYGAPRRATAAYRLGRPQQSRPTPGEAHRGLPGASARPSIRCGHRSAPAASPAALTIARMSAFTPSGSVGQASMMLARSGSIGAFSAPTAPDSAPPIPETGVFPEENDVGSSPASATVGKTH